MFVKIGGGGEFVHKLNLKLCVCVCKTSQYNYIFYAKLMNFIIIFLS